MAIDVKAEFRRRHELRRAWNHRRTALEAQEAMIQIKRACLRKNVNNTEERWKRLYDFSMLRAAYKQFSAWPVRVGKVRVRKTVMNRFGIHEILLYGYGTSYVEVRHHGYYLFEHAPVGGCVRWTTVEDAKRDFEAVAELLLPMFQVSCRIENVPVSRYAKKRRKDVLVVTVSPVL